MNKIIIPEDKFSSEGLEKILSRMPRGVGHVMHNPRGYYEIVFFDTPNNNNEPSNEILERIDKLNRPEELKYKDRRIEDSSKLYHLLSKIPYGCLATIKKTDDDGKEHMPQPDICPLSFVYVPEKDMIYIHSESGDKGQKTQNIIGNENICFNINGYDGIVLAQKLCDIDMKYWSINIFGTASIVEDPTEKAMALRLYREKVMGDLPIQILGNMGDKLSDRREYTIIKIDMKKIIGKENSS